MVRHMLRIVTWNIQWGLGIDGIQNLSRLIGDARAIADFDVLRLQEVSANFANLKGNDGAISLRSWDISCRAIRRSREWAWIFPTEKGGVAASAT